MPLHHHVLAASYGAMRLRHAVGGVLRPGTTDRLRVLLYHDVPPESQELFAAQLRWIAQRWRFVTPEEFVAMAAGEVPIVGRNVLLTFDDGYLTDRIVAERILGPLGIRAMFFVIPDFVACRTDAEAQRFVATRIVPGLSPYAVPDHARNMDWDDLAWLQDRGHTIGAHTRSHPRLSSLHDTGELEAEIVDCAEVLGRRLGSAIDHFAFPFGDCPNFSPAAMRIATRRYRTVFSGLRGENKPPVPLTALRRDAIPPGASNRLAGALLEGAADLPYRRQRNRIDGWAVDAPARPTDLEHNSELGSTC